MTTGAGRGVTESRRRPPLIACVNRRYDDRFPGESRARLRVKNQMPLGEGWLRELIGAREQWRRGG